MRGLLGLGVGQAVGVGAGFDDQQPGSARRHRGDVGSSDSWWSIARMAAGRSVPTCSHTTGSAGLSGPRVRVARGVVVLLFGFQVRAVLGDGVLVRDGQRPGDGGVGPAGARGGVEESEFALQSGGS